MHFSPDGQLAQHCAKIREGSIFKYRLPDEVPSEKDNSSLC